MLTNLKIGICAIFVVILHLRFAKSDVKITDSTVTVAEAAAPAPDPVAVAVAEDTAAVAGGDEAVEAAVLLDDAGATCYAETKNMYFPLETRHCCKHLKLKCQAVTEQDNFCLLKTDEEFKAFGECCKSRGAGRGIEVDPDPPGAKDCQDSK